MKEVSNVLTTAFKHNSESGKKKKKKRKEMRQHFSTPLIMSVSPLVSEKTSGTQGNKV